MLWSRLLAFIFPFLLMAASGQSQTVYTVERIPDPKKGGTGYVSDPDGILSAEDVARLNALIGSLEQNATAQVAIVIVNSIGEDNPKEFATRLFKHLEIGQADKDNGLLLFSVMDQRRTEFETGDGLEGVLPDVICYRIGMQELVPYFKEEKYGQGLYAAAAAIKAQLENPDNLEEVRSSGNGRQSWAARPIPGIPGVLGWYLIVTVLVHLFLLAYLLHVQQSKQDLYDRYQAMRPFRTLLLVFLFPAPYLLAYFYLGWRLKRLRNFPRYSKLNGKPMHKLDETDDDEFLEKGQIVEEEIGVIDYDVWVTEDRDDVLVLPYARGWTKYQSCPKCHYRTYYKARSQVIQPATYSYSGKKLLIHKCKNCDFVDKKTVIIPVKVRSGGGGSSSGGGGSSSWGGGSSSGGGAGVSW